MQTRPARLVLAAAMALACSDAPLDPNAAQTPTPAPPQAPPGWPPEVRPALIYENGPGGSRYVLYEDRTFRIQYPGFAEGYPGTYSVADSVITFTFDAAKLRWNFIGVAIGTVSGDKLRVTYDFNLSMTDFVDGTWTRSPSSTFDLPKP